MGRLSSGTQHRLLQARRTTLSAAANASRGSEANARTVVLGNVDISASMAAATDLTVVDCRGQNSQLKITCA